MMRSRTMNMTQGRPLRMLCVFALPLLIGNLFQQAYNLADSIIVGRILGAPALAAVGATGSITFLFFSLCNGIGGGCGIVTAQYYGAGDDARVRRAIANSAMVMIVSSVVMGGIAWALTPWALETVMGTPKEILPDAITYMRMMCLSVPLVAVYNYASSMLRALGDSRTPLYFLVVACLLNVGLDLLCVGVLKMEVFGAAFATMLAQLLAGVGCLVFALRSNPYFKISREEMRVDWEIVRHAVRLGLPLALQWSMIAISTTALQRVVNGFGPMTIAAFTATNRIEQLTQQPFGSLGLALSTYAGQNYGARRLERVREGLRDAMLVMAAFSAVMLAIMHLMGPVIMSAFVDETAVVEMGGEALKITSWFYIFLGTIYMTRGALNGVGDSLFSFINGAMEMVGRILLPIAMLNWTSAGEWTIWWTAGLTWAISAAACLMRWYMWSAKNLGRVKTAAALPNGNEGRGRGVTALWPRQARALKGHAR